MNLLPGSRQGGFRGSDLRFGHQVAALGIVDLLLGDQAGPFGHYRRQAVGGKMRHLVHLLGALEFVLGAGHLGVASLRTGVGAAQIVAHLRYFERGQQLPLPHPVADIDIDLLDIAGDLRHHVDLLKRLELRRQYEIPCEIFGRYFGHGDGGNIRCRSRCSLLFGAGNTEQERSDTRLPGQPFATAPSPHAIGEGNANVYNRSRIFWVL